VFGPTCIHRGPCSSTPCCSTCTMPCALHRFHCHNLVHEDYDMLRAMTIISRDDSTSQTLTARNAPTEMVSLIKVAGVCDWVHWVCGGDSQAPA
jgi:hypothetical protein